jgi:hypothetical protein
MPREQQHALASGQRLTDAFVAVELDARPNLIGSDRTGNAARSCRIARRRWAGSNV